MNSSRASEQWLMTFYLTTYLEITDVNYVRMISRLYSYCLTPINL
jgi:hypothetical protein